MKKIMFGAVCLLLISATTWAQTLTIPDRIEKLSTRARDSVNITLEGALLQLAGQFLNSGNSDERAVKDVVSKLKGIHVRTFEFDREGEYTDSDLDAIRSQLKPPMWSRVVEAKEHGEHTQIFVKQERDALGGLVILSAERRELSIVIIDGAIDLKRLSALSGNFGIPNVAIPETVKTGTAIDSAE